MSTPVKTIFQIKYESKINFFDRLYKNEELIEKFPHWETDRLRVTLHDFEKKHSLTIAYNNATYDSDLYDKNNEDEIISFLISKITNIVDDGSFSRIGLRRFYLIKQEMSFDELVEIIYLKLFTDDFQKLFINPIENSSITINANYNEYKYRLILQPIQKDEVPKLIQYSDYHLERDLPKRMEELNKIFFSYPDVALLLDIDYFLVEKKLRQESLIKFWDTSRRDINHIIKNIISMIFEEKIKK